MSEVIDASASRGDGSDLTERSRRVVNAKRRMVEFHELLKTVRRLKFLYFMDFGYALTFHILKLPSNLHGGDVITGTCPYLMLSIMMYLLWVVCLFDLVDMIVMR
jgi:hypothetical protein